MCAESTLCTDEKICWRFKVLVMLKPDCYDLMAFHVIDRRKWKPLIERFLVVFLGDLRGIIPFGLHFIIENFIPSFSCE